MLNFIANLAFHDTVLIKCTFDHKCYDKNYMEISLNSISMSRNIISRKIDTFIKIWQIAIDII
jgi:hypothetical protein